MPLGLYLHIPFCRKRCKFCYFRVYTDKNAGDVETYVAALSREIELVSRLPVMGGRPFRFVYFGGGTPSFLSAKQLTSLVDRLRANINWDQAEEVTFECEPGTLAAAEGARRSRELGVTRLSLGVENFSDAVLEENGRAHLSGEIYQVLGLDHGGRLSQRQHRPDRRHGRRDVGQLEGHASRRTIELSPDSVTIYQMELPFNTVYSQRHAGPPRRDRPSPTGRPSGPGSTTPSTSCRPPATRSPAPTRWSRTSSKVNFSYRDNLWHGADLLATGVASFGHVSGVHYQNEPDWAGLRRAARSGASCRWPAACGPRRTNCWSAR